MPKDYDSGLAPLPARERSRFKSSYRDWKQRYRAEHGVGPVESFRQTDTGAEMEPSDARQKVREEYRESKYKPEKSKKRMRFSRSR